MITTTEEKWEDGLNPDEMKLLELLRDSRTRWPALYLCLQRLRDNHLFQGGHFTPWLRNFCEHAGCSESKVWDALRAGRIYEVWSNNRPDVPKIENVEVEPQNLIIVQRIASLDPSQKDDLMLKVLKKQIRRRDLLEESVRQRIRRQREKLGIKLSALPWREMDLRQPPYGMEYRSILEKIRLYYDNASIDGCKRIVDALHECLTKIEQEWKEE